MTQVNIGKNITIDVDFAALPEAALAHVLYIGAQNILMDSHASITKESNPNDMAEAAMAMAEKKLAALMAGDIRQRTFGTRGDAVKARAVVIALRHVKPVKGADGKVDPKATRAEALKRVAANPAFTALAQKQIDEEKALGIDGDIEV